MTDQTSNQTAIQPASNPQPADGQTGGVVNQTIVQSNVGQTPVNDVNNSLSQSVSAPPITTAQATPIQTASTVPAPMSQSDALSVLEAAIAQASQQSDVARQAAEKTLQRATEETGELAQVLPSAILTATNTLNPVTPTTTAKESEGLKSPDKSNQAEAGTGIQAVEVEKNPELPPEVEGFINKVEQQADQLPKEIVIADAIKNLPQHHPLPKQPVIILPITPEIEKAGATKSPKFSVRWLVEWSRRIMKMFVGKVIYRQT